MISDARRAIILDDKNQEALNLLAIGLMESEKDAPNSFSKIEEAIKTLETSSFCLYIYKKFNQ